jgi:hypothetical protein
MRVSPWVASNRKNSRSPERGLARESVRDRQRRIAGDRPPIWKVRCQMPIGPAGSVCRLQRDPHRKGVDGGVQEIARVALVITVSFVFVDGRSSCHFNSHMVFIFSRSHSLAISRNLQIRNLRHVVLVAVPRQLKKRSNLDNATPEAFLDQLQQQKQTDATVKSSTQRRRHVPQLETFSGSLFCPPVALNVEVGSEGKPVSHS